MRNIFHNSEINFCITCKVKFQVCKRELHLCKIEFYFCKIGIHFCKIEFHLCKIDLEIVFKLKIIKVAFIMFHNNMADNE